MERYEHVRAKAKKYYSSIGMVTCPSLDNEKVLFTDAGFNHLVRKGSIPRTIKDQMRRFHLLKHVLAVIRSKIATVSVRKNKQVIFWTLEERIKNKNIKVVIRQIKGGAKHFLSIMDYD